MFYCLLPLLLLCDGLLASEEYGNRPRGVEPQKAALYQQRDEYECLDGSKKIPFEQVNDDYCDCKDGSDEPGTSACSNGRFYCRNAGYKPLIVPSSRVNDFICDCCDGSDEWDSGVQCPNVCDTQGAKAREEAKQSRIVQEAGYAKRLELSKEGAKSLEEKKTEVEKQKQELEQLEPLKNSIEGKKTAAEEKEREAIEKHDNAWNELKEERKNDRAKELFAQMDLDSDEKFTFEEFHRFKNQFFEPEHIEPEAAEAQGVLQEIFGDLKELDFIGFRNVYDKVKDVVAKLKAQVKQDEKKEESEQESKDTSEAPATTTAVPSVGEEATKEEEGQQEHEDGQEEGEHEEQQDESEHSEIKEEDEENEDKDKPPHDEVTQVAINEANTARQDLEEINRKIGDLEGSIRTSESFLEFEYGSDHAWAPYRGQCAELTTTQYTYKLCLFDRSVQKDRNGHSEVNLGYWGSWNGPENNKFASMKYDKGQSCWNGPERSTHVDIECGEELQLIDASEPNKCEYRFLLKSPAACANPVETDRNEHSEL